MESIVRKLKIQTYKAQLAFRHYVCAALAKELEAGTLTAEQKAALAHRWDDTLKESHVLQLMIDLLERQEKEDRGSTESPIPKE